MFWFCFSLFLYYFILFLSLFYPLFSRNTASGALITDKREKSAMLQLILSSGMSLIGKPFPQKFGENGENRMPQGCAMPHISHEFEAPEYVDWPASPCAAAARRLNRPPGRRAARHGLRRPTRCRVSRSLIRVVDC